MPLINYDQINKKVYVSLKDGDSIEGVPVGKWYKYWSIFKDPVEYQEWEEGRSTRFKLNLVIKTGDKWDALIFNQGKETISRLSVAMQEHGKDSLFKISRTGSGKKDTQYKVEFVRALEENEINEISKVELNQLEKKEESDLPFLR